MNKVVTGDIGVVLYLAANHYLNVNWELGKWMLNVTESISVLDKLHLRLTGFETGVDLWRETNIHFVFSFLLNTLCDF